MGKRLRLVLLALLALTAANGCASMSNTERGAAAGGLLGTAVGAAVGRDHGRTGTGAAIGGLTGTLIGAAVGKSADEDDRRAKEAAALAAAPVNGPLSIEQVANMAKAGVGDALIINQIRTSGTRYNLDSDSIVWLQQNSVSQAVIMEMQNTNRRPHRTVVVREPVIYERPAVVYEPVFVAPPPRPGFSVGFGYSKMR